MGRVIRDSLADEVSFELKFVWVKSGPCKDLGRAHPRQREQQVQRVDGSKLGLFKERKKISVAGA